MKIVKKVLFTLAFVILALLLIVGVNYVWRGKARNVHISKEVVAHRGVHLNYQKGVYDPVSGCEAKHIFPPTHEYIGNTIASIGKAFDEGATIVEIDIRKTADSNLVVFHDYMLDCRTDGEGLVKEHDLAYLQTLDIGYGYTPDGGETYPFRGKGVGLMPSLDEVLTAYPNKTFLIDHKDWDAESTAILIRILTNYPEAQRRRLYLWSRPEHVQTIQARYPEMRPLFLLRSDVKKHFLPFFLSFGILRVPNAYAGRVMAIPAKYIPYVWGWPYRFLDAVHKTGLTFYIMLDTTEDAKKYAAVPVDGYVTDYIEVVGRTLRP